MTKFLTFLFVLFMVFAGCARTDEAPRLEADTEKTMGEVITDPVCGMNIEKSAALTVEHEGITYHVCSVECKEALLKDPEKYTKAEMVIDPACGMNIPASSEHTHTHHDKMYHFCSSVCKEKFEKEPEKFLKTK